MTHPCGLVLFTKPTHPGRVKTRLIGELTATEAADLHAAFRDDLLERLDGGAFELTIAWALEAGEESPGGPLPGIAQWGSDLGERLFNALDRMSAKHRFVAAVGSDHPLLAREQVEEAFARLTKGAEVVLGPASDGGYYLIAARRERLKAEIFRDIAWSTSAVRAQTRERCAALGLNLVELSEASDVDTPTDLVRLERFLANDTGERCPRTRSLLRRWGRLETA